MLGCGFAVGTTAPSTAAASASPSPDPELQALLRGVETKYNHLTTLRMHFRQTYKQGQQVLREEGGTLYLRKPGQMRWEYENPEPKLFLTDGRLLTLYVPAEKRVTQTKITESEDLRSPMRFLLGKLRFQKEFQQIERDPDVAPLDRNDIVMRAVPKQMNGLESVVMEITRDHEIRRLILKEPGGVQTDFRFTDEAENPALSPDLFRFQPPQGTEIIRE